MSGVNELTLEGYVKDVQAFDKYATAIIVVDKYDFQSKGFIEQEYKVFMAGWRDDKRPNFEKMEDGKPIRFRGSVDYDKNGNLILKGKFGLHYLGRFEQKAPQPAAAGGGSSYGDEPPF